MKCLSVDADENVGEKDDANSQAEVVKEKPTQVAPKHLSRFQMKCVSCDFRVGNAAVLERHSRVKHPDLKWYRCKLCNFFAATSEWMEVHLCSDGHQQQQDEKMSPASSSFESYVESVSRDCAGDGAEVDQVVGGEKALTEKEQEGDEAAEAVMSASAEEEDGEFEPPRKKRGRPKQGSSTTCGHCGLVVSNATNLSVHIRRKHSKEYGYSCTLCNYSCVTKGDMDRHCFTKKHIKRAQGGSNKNPDSCHIQASLPEATTTQISSAQGTEGTQEAEDTVVGEDKAEEQTQSDVAQQQSKYDSVNACSLCDFVAQSIPSLHLHVKRKHTKDFEYVCLACGYYAVTNREMYRHANTDKHKQRSQKYLELQGGEQQKISEVPLGQKEIIAPPGENFDPSPEDPNSADVSADVSADADEKNAIASSGLEPDPTNATTEQAELPEPQQASGELEVNESSLQESLDEKGEEFEEHVNADVIVDTQMSKAPPFDAAIVSVKDLGIQEHAPLESSESSTHALCSGASPLDFTLTSSAHVKKHKLKEVKMKDETRINISRIRCEDCGFMADGISGLNVHISMKHPSKERHFHCLVCGKSFYTESNLHQHLTSAAHLRNEQNSVEELPEGGSSFKCVKCTDRFESEQDLFFHIKEKHEELLREVNKYVLEDTEQINREREENQGNVCKYCGKVCKSSNSMAFLAHIRTHTGKQLPLLTQSCFLSTAVSISYATFTLGLAMCMQAATSNESLCKRAFQAFKILAFTHRYTSFKFIFGFYAQNARPLYAR